MLANECKLSTSTHKPALRALLFLYRQVSGVGLPWLNNKHSPRGHGSTGGNESGRHDPPLQRIKRRQTVLGMPSLVLLLRPSRLHQAQGGIKRVAARVVG